MLARGGARPLLIERSAEPRDMVCGGFLGWDALAALRRLGVEPDDLGARPIARLRLIAGKRLIETSLPHPAAGLSRRTLDEALLRRAACEGAAIERGNAVKRAEIGTSRHPGESRDPWMRSPMIGHQAESMAPGFRRGDDSGRRFAVHLDDRAIIESEALFLATGKYELRGLARPKRPVANPVVGLRTRLPPSPALSAALHDVIELHLFRQGYAGLLLQEDGSANLCLSVAASRLAEAGGKADALIAAIAHEAPLLAERFAETPDRWLTIAGVPYGWRARATAQGLFRLGDQAAVIASLAGDGIAIALRSGRVASEQYLRQGPSGAERYQAAFSRHAARPLIIAGVLRTLGESAAAPGLLALFGNIPRIPALLARLTRIGI